MMDAAESLERDAEERRAKVESTLDQLKDRMSVEQMIGEVGRFVGLDDAGATLRSLGRQVQANPLAIGLVGIGLAWLVFGGKDSVKSPTQWSSRRWKGPVDAAGSGGIGGGLTNLAGEGVTKIRDAMGTAATRAADLAETARDRMHDGKGKLRDTASSIGQQAAAQMEDRPLLVGGLAVLVGTIAGIALPRTEAENRLMGRQSDQLLEDAKEASRAMRDRAAQAAQRTYDTAVISARDEGLLPSGDATFTSKVGAVAEAALTEAKRQVDPVLHGDDGSSDRG